MVRLLACQLRHLVLTRVTTRCSSRLRISIFLPSSRIGTARQDELLRLAFVLLQLCESIALSGVIHGFAASQVAPSISTVRSPHLVLILAPLLPFRMLVRAIRPRARVVPTRYRAVRKGTSFDLTICPVPAWTRIWVSERAHSSCRAIREELAVHFGLRVLCSLSGR